MKHLKKFNENSEFDIVKNILLDILDDYEVNYEFIMGNFGGYNNNSLKTIISVDSKDLNDLESKISKSINRIESFGLEVFISKKIHRNRRKDLIVHTWYIPS